MSFTIAYKHGVVIIFAELISGFHYVLGNAREVFGVSPSLVAFGKGRDGYPIPAVADHKDSLSRLNRRYSAAFVGNSILMVASLATLKKLEQPSSSRLDKDS